MKSHPETMNEPLISMTIQTILIEQMRDELKYGVQHYPDGTTVAMAQQLDAFQDLAARAMADRQLTWTHLLLCQTYQALAREDSGELYKCLSYLGRTVVQWMEDLDARRGGV